MLIVFFKKLLLIITISNSLSGLTKPHLKVIGLFSAFLVGKNALKHILDGIFTFSL